MSPKTIENSKPADLHPRDNSFSGFDTGFQLRIKRNGLVVVPVKGWAYDMIGFDKAVVGLSSRWKR